MHSALLNIDLFNLLKKTHMVGKLGFSVDKVKGAVRE